MFYDKIFIFFPKQTNRHKKSTYLPINAFCLVWKRMGGRLPLEGKLSRSDLSPVTDEVFFAISRFQYSHLIRILLRKTHLSLKGKAFWKAFRIVPVCFVGRYNCRGRTLGRPVLRAVGDANSYGFGWFCFAFSASISFPFSAIIESMASSVSPSMPFKNSLFIENPFFLLRLFTPVASACSHSFTTSRSKFRYKKSTLYCYRMLRL